MNPKIEYYSNGKIWSEVWRNEDERFHRLDGPAYRFWFESGQLKREMWCINGSRHRLDGPAYQVWLENGQARLAEWYINGVEYNTEAEFQVAVDLYNANEIAELF